MIYSGIDLRHVGNEIVTNPRLRAGLWMIVLIILVWVSLVWSDYNSGRYKIVRDLERDLSSLYEIESAAVWRARLIQADESVRILRQKIDKAETPGLAMAKLQNALTKLAEESLGVRVDIEVGRPQYLEKISASRVRARVKVSLTPAALITFLTNLEAEQQMMSIEQLTMVFNKRRWAIDTTVVRYFAIEGANRE